MSRELDLSPLHKRQQKIESFKSFLHQELEKILRGSKNPDQKPCYDTLQDLEWHPSTSHTKLNQLIQNLKEQLKPASRTFLKVFGVSWENTLTRLNRQFPESEIPRQPMP